MDRLTRSIIRCLQWPRETDVDFGFRPTYWTISKKLNVPAKSVKLRLQKLTDAGVVNHFRVVPRIEIFGFERTGVVFAMNARAVQKIKENLHLLDFVEAIHIATPFKIPGELSRYGNPFDSLIVSVDLIHEDERDLERFTSLLRGLVGEFTLAYETNVRYPVAGANVGSAGATILRELIREPFCTIHDLGLAAGLSEGSVRKYFRELQRTRSYRFEPVVDATKIDSFSFAVGLPIDESIDRAEVFRKLKNTLEENWLLDNIGTKGAAGLICVADNLAEVEERFASLRSDSLLEGSILLLGVQTINNQANVCYMRKQVHRENLIRA
jgi:DNA-binding Lrp family transcriptional regulator